MCRNLSVPFPRRVPSFDRSFHGEILCLRIFVLTVSLSGRLIGHGCDGLWGSCIYDWSGFFQM